MKKKTRVKQFEQVILEDINKNLKSSMETVGRFYKEHPEFEESE